jgi:hypothetical protein
MDNQFPKFEGQDSPIEPYYGPDQLPYQLPSFVDSLQDLQSQQVS